MLKQLLLLSVTVAALGVTSGCGDVCASAKNEMIACDIDPPSDVDFDRCDEQDEQFAECVHDKSCDDKRRCL